MPHFPGERGPCTCFTLRGVAAVYSLGGLNEGTKQWDPLSLSTFLWDNSRLSFAPCPECRPQSLVRGTLCKLWSFGHIGEAELVPLPAAVIVDEGVVRLLNVDIISHAEHVTGCLWHIQGFQWPLSAKRDSSPTAPSHGMYPTIHPSIHLPTYPLTLQPSIYQPLQLPFHPSTHTPIYPPSIHLSNHPLIHPIFFVRLWCAGHITFTIVFRTPLSYVTLCTYL